MRNHPKYQQPKKSKKKDEESKKKEKEKETEKPEKSTKSKDLEKVEKKPNEAKQSLKQSMDYPPVTKVSYVKLDGMPSIMNYQHSLNETTFNKWCQRYKPYVIQEEKQSEMISSSSIISFASCFVSSS